MTMQVADRLRRPAVLVFGLTLAGLVLRLYAVGKLGFRWDEDLTSISVKAVLEHGYPLLDSGMVYPRFLPLQYLLAGWVQVVGFSEYALRLPIAVIGTALVPITYLIARDLVGRSVAVLAAALMAFDFWQVELARTARMYAPFFVIYGLFFIATYRGLVWKERPWRIALIPIGLLAVLMHDVGLFCAGLALIAPVVFPDLRRDPLPYIVSATVIVATLAMQRFTGLMWSLSERPDEVAAIAYHVQLAGVLGGFEQTLERLGGFLYLPRLVFVQSWLNSGPGIATWGAISCVAVGLVLVFLRNATPGSRAIGIGAVVVAAFHQFTLALLVWAFFGAWQVKGVRGLISGQSLRLAGILALVGAFWLGAALSMGYELAKPEPLIKGLFEYPRFRMVMAYPMHRPFMTVFAVIGALAVFDKCARPEPDRNSVMLVGGFLVSYLAVGVFATVYSHFRYVLHADVFFMTFAGLGILIAADVAINLSRGRIEPGPKEDAATPAASVALAILIAALAVNPLRAALAVSRDYVVESRVGRWMDLGAWPDYKTTSAYILDHRRPDDQILVLNPREFYNYLGEVDGWIRSGNYGFQVVEWNGRLHDRYIGAPVISTVEELRQTIEGAPGRTWLPFSRHVLDFDRFGGVNSEIAEFLRANADRRVTIGRDGTMLVYLFPGSISSGS